MNWFFALMEVGPAIRSATGWARSLKGAEARVALLGCLIVDVVLAWLTWFFDIQTTLIYAQQIQSKVLETLTEGALVYAPIMLIIITIAPTALRQTLSGVAQNLKFLAAAIVLINLFDARTDWPRVKELFDNPLMWDLFSWMQIGGSDAPAYAVWYVSRIVFWFMATDGFEVLLVAMLCATLLLVVNSFRRQSSAGQATTRLSNP